jgi:hypothetical protein
MASGMELFLPWERVSNGKFRRRAVKIKLSLKAANRSFYAFF